MSPEGKGQFNPEEKNPANEEVKSAQSPMETVARLKKELLSKKILGLIKAIIGKKNPDIQETDRDDIAQKTLIDVLRNIETGNFDGSRADLKTYLYRAVTNKAIYFSKQKQRHYNRELELDELKSADTKTINEIESWINTEYVRKMIPQLPPRMRQIVELKLQEHTEDYIAKELNIAVGTVKSMYFKALKRLREIIAKDKKNNAD